MSSILNCKYDTLKLILTKYKDTIDLNYIYVGSNNKIAAIHLICYKKEDQIREGDIMFVQMKNLNLNYPTKECPTPILFYNWMIPNDKILSILIQNPQLDINITADNDMNGSTLFSKLISLKKTKLLKQIINNRQDLKVFRDEYKNIQIPYMQTQKMDYRNNYRNEFINFFLRGSDDEITNRNKKKLIMENKAAFACLIARYSCANEFEKFLDDYEIDINLIEETTILFFFFKIKLLY